MFRKVAIFTVQQRCQFTAVSASRRRLARCAPGFVPNPGHTALISEVAPKSDLGCDKSRVPHLGVVLFSRAELDRSDDYDILPEETRRAHNGSLFPRSASRYGISTVVTPRRRELG